MGDGGKYEVYSWHGVDLPDGDMVIDVGWRGWRVKRRREYFDGPGCSAGPARLDDA